MRNLFCTIILFLFAASVLSEQHEPLRIAVISDLNGSYGSSEYHRQIPLAMQSVINMQPDLVISTGDMVAGQRSRPLLKTTQLQNMWTAFHKNVSNPLADAQLPFAVTPGNHDASNAKKFKLEREIYQQQWMEREPDLHFIDKSHYPFYYAFSLKNVLFISLDATMVGHLPQAQKDWLKKILMDAENKYRQRIVFSHLPLWPFAQQREADILGDHELEQMLQKFQVALYLSGHHHVFYPGYKDGISYVSQACLGSGLRKYIGTKLRSKRGFTLIDINENDQIKISAYEAPDFNIPIDFNSLPEQIKSRYVTLIRDDLRNGH